MDNSEQVISTIALSFIPGVGFTAAKRLIEEAGGAQNVFARKEMFHDKFIPGCNDSLEKLLTNCHEAMERAHREYEFAEKNGIRCLTPDDEDYPVRMRECDDAPTLLFFKGHADLNPRHSVAIVGTRHITDYGRRMCDNFVHDLSELCPDVLIMSGLAYGVDIQAHRAALANGLNTIGTLAHGLDRIYPSAHRPTAVEMLNHGGLITEFYSGTNPDRYNFVSRNRIIAGMADATIVVESASKGGSLITADIAMSYHRDCFAVPGRVGDEFSEGCNSLIHDNKAALLTSADDFVKAMGWGASQQGGRHKAVQRQLFPDLSAEEELVVKALQERGDLQINALVVETDIPINKMNALLFELEMKGVIRVLAGGVYQLMG